MKNATANAMAALRNPKHEQFAFHVSLGEPLYRAYALAYRRSQSDDSVRGNAARLWHHLRASPKIRKRVKELMAKKRKAAELTYDDLLNDVLLNADLAREAGQHAPALTALKMLGGEMYHAFTERKETVNLDIKCNSKAELRELLVTEYGEQAADLIWQAWSKPKQIEGNVTELEPITEPTQEPQDCTLHGPITDTPSHVDGIQSHVDGTQNEGVVLDNADNARARDQIGDIERLALQSLANSKAPKV